MMPKMFSGAAFTFSGSEVDSVFTAPAVRCPVLFPRGCRNIEEEDKICNYISKAVLFSLTGYKSYAYL